jgi:hypothetical protein
MIQDWESDLEGKSSAVEVSFVAIVDRVENSTCLQIGSGRQVWVPNQYMGKIDELRGVVYIDGEFAEENELIRG